MPKCFQYWHKLTRRQNNVMSEGIYLKWVWIAHARNWTAKWCVVVCACRWFDVRGSQQRPHNFLNNWLSEHEHWNTTITYTHNGVTLLLNKRALLAIEGEIYFCCWIVICCDAKRLCVLGLAVWWNRNTHTHTHTHTRILLGFLLCFFTINTTHFYVWVFVVMRV